MHNLYMSCVKSITQGVVLENLHRAIQPSSSSTLVQLQNVLFIHEKKRLKQFFFFSGNSDTSGGEHLLPDAVAVSSVCSWSMLKSSGKKGGVEGSLLSPLGHASGLFSEKPSNQSSGLKTHKHTHS